MQVSKSGKIIYQFLTSLNKKLLIRKCKIISKHIKLLHGEWEIGITNKWFLKIEKPSNNSTYQINFLDAHNL